MSDSIHIGFVCQAGRLEAQSCLLAASIIAQLGSRVRMTAALAGADSDRTGPAGRTLDFLEALGTQIHPVENPISPDYPIGNKLACLRVLENTAEVSLFMDTDMIVTGDFLCRLDSDFEFMAKPADAATASLDHNAWRQLFSSHGVPIPRSRYLSTHTAELGFPYFNAGFIGLSGEKTLADCWILHAKRLAEQRGRHDYHLDQISLTLAVYDQGLVVRPVSELLNFPAHLRPVPENDSTAVVHYHQADRISGSHRVRNLLSRLVNDYPMLGPILADDPEWGWTTSVGQQRKYFGSAFRKGRNAGSNFIITGIPRSGTSLLSSCIDGMGDTIVINEPAEIFGALEHPGGFGLAAYHQQLRGRILSGQAVPNKVDAAGRLVEDTLVSDARSELRYRRESEDFPLGTKNTLAYTARLEQIAETMPSSPILFCIRNPISTIASWTRSFEHLRTAVTGKARIGTSNDPYLAGLERQQLERIEAEDDVEIRRALWWNFLAGRALKNINRITVVRYEDFAADPAACLRSVGTSLGASKKAIDRQVARMKPLTAVDRAQELSDFQLESIRGICATTAARFGYDV
ncbi:MAG: hypothetical protein CMP07_14565 [Xanthomonadales bacterium]|nr:hypothetical protein [Xanthomonadales bacterium]